MYAYPSLNIGGYIYNIKYRAIHPVKQHAHPKKTAKKKKYLLSVCYDGKCVICSTDVKKRKTNPYN